MRMRYAIAAALALIAASCGQAMAPAGEETPAPAEIPGSAPAADTTFCEEVGRRVSVADCEDLSRLADNAQRGSAAFNAPNPMRRGETHTLQLAISLEPPPEEPATPVEQPAPPSEPTGATPAPPAAPSEMVDDLPGQTVEFAPLVGRFMKAELVGGGFDIESLSPASQEVLHDSVTTWNWRVTAREGGDQTLTLRTVVEGCTPDGQCFPLRSTSRNVAIAVDVSLIGQARDFLTAAPDWIKLVAAVIAGLAALIGAVFSLRKAFRKGREGA